MAGVSRRRRRIVLLVGVSAMVIMATPAVSRGLTGGNADSRLLVAQISKGTSWSSGEGWVVANQQNPQRLAADWTALPDNGPLAAVDTPPGPRPIQCGVAYSNNGGASWVEGTIPFQPANLPSNPGGCADPTLVEGSDGTLYALHNGGSLVPGAGTSSPGLPSLVTLSVSRDGGHSWSNPGKVWSFEDTPKDSATSGSPDFAFDRPWLAIDPQTSTLYASISDDALVERVILASHDHGATWSTPYPLDPDNQSIWADGISAAHGLIAAAYSVDPNSRGYRTAASPAVKCAKVCAVFETSGNDGKTWARHVLPAPSVASPSPAPTEPGLEVAADPFIKGRYAVLVPATTALLQLWVTSDGGITWAKPFTINASGTDTVVKPWISFGTTGALGLVWRELHKDNSYDVYTSVSRNGGITFATPVELTPGPAPPDTPPQGTPGDDCACNLYLNGQYLYTTWGDSRRGNLQVWFARYRY